MFGISQSGFCGLLDACKECTLVWVRKVDVDTARDMCPGDGWRRPIAGCPGVLVLRENRRDSDMLLQ